jgi:PPP family 3-phenylpropionic acid transporter
MNAMLCVGVARVLGSVGGGFVSDLTSIRQTFLYGSLVALVGVVVFGVVFSVRKEGTIQVP